MYRDAEGRPGMLDELVDTIETLKARISEHRSILQASEAQTRYSLIDPLLRALGWDTADTALVRPEFMVGGRRADYALLNAQDDVVVFLEAKSLGENLTSHRSQVAAYASELGIRYPALTNGSEWEVFDNLQMAPIEQRRILNVSLANEDSASCALKLLLLWRPNMASGQPIEASEPIVGAHQPKSSARIAEPQPTSASQVSPPQLHPQPVQSAPDSNWHSLRDFIVRDGKNCPPKLRLPTGEERDTSNWRAILIEMTEWLIRDGALTPDKCPVTAGHREPNCLINLVPEYKDGRAFPSNRKLTNGLFLNLHHSAYDIVVKCKAMMEELGKDPATVHVQVS